jgi:hypothetical protein
MATGNRKAAAAISSVAGVSGNPGGVIRGHRLWAG